MSLLRGTIVNAGELGTGTRSLPQNTEQKGEEHMKRARGMRMRTKGATSKSEIPEK